MLTDVKLEVFSSRVYSDSTNSASTSSTSNSALPTYDLKDKPKEYKVRPDPKSELVYAPKFELVESEEVDCINLDEFDCIEHENSKLQSIQLSEINCESSLNPNDQIESVCIGFPDFSNEIHIFKECSFFLSLSDSQSSISSDSSSDEELSFKQDSVISPFKLANPERIGNINQHLHDDNKITKLEYVYRISKEKRLERIRDKKNSNCGCF